MSSVHGRLLPRCFGQISAAAGRGFSPTCKVCFNRSECCVQEAIIAQGGTQPSAEPALPSFEQEVRTVLDNLATVLIDKNRKYGDSALNPKRVFSRASAVEQLKVRLDDKISRMANQQPNEDEDVELDLMGYLVLLRIAKGRAGREEALDHEYERMSLRG